MPKLKLIKKKTKTFDGCWSCRERGIKCDELKPECVNCLRNSINCKGYDIRLSWDTKKTDNLRRFKVYDHFEKGYFYIQDVIGVILEIDDLIENSSSRNLVRLPFTVFESNRLIQYWSDSIANNYNLQWFKSFMLRNLSNQNVIYSIYASSCYFANQFTKADQYKLKLYQEFSHVHESDDLNTQCWIFSLLNLMLSSDFVVEMKFDYFEARNKIESLLPYLNAESIEYNNIINLLQFINSLKFAKPQKLNVSDTLQGIGLTSKLLQSWYQVLSINSNTDISFFQLENELWFNKMSLILPLQHNKYHKSYTWYISMYIYFIKKFYHSHHGRVSINYLINEAIPHLQQLDYNLDFFGLRWCLFIISNESNNPKCDEILSIHLPKLHVPTLTKDQDWIQYIESSSSIII